MSYPNKFAIQYKNQTIPVYIVGDIQYLCFVARIPQEGEVNLCLDFEDDGSLKWLEMPGDSTPRAYELGRNIQKQMEKEGFSLQQLRMQV